MLLWLKKTEDKKRVAMGIRLKKLEVLDDTVVEAMTQPQLVDRVKLLQQRIATYEERLFRSNRQTFGSKSEKSEPNKIEENKLNPKARAETTKLPSARYPEAIVREDHIDFTAPQECKCCGSTMQDSGMTEDSEYLDVLAKKYIVVDQKRHKHRCPNCHGSITTAPAPARITPGGSYGDGFIVDATLSKYCDLIPVERYCDMAARGGLVGLPPHSVIQATFQLADFFGGVYQRIKDETLRALVLLADETPHKMLEGDAKKSWYLWGFSSETSCFFECHDSRSGDVSSDILKLSNCLVLVSDAYTGYMKSVREANKLRSEHGLALIRIAYCNAHARRRFFSGEKDSANDVGEDARFMLDQYKEIYRLNAESKGKSREEILAKRVEMKPYFEAMKAEALLKKDTYSSQSAIANAYEYFLKHYDGLTLFLENASVPIDNNPSERLLRSPVVGRKTWYGTHSRKGAAVAAVHFTIVGSCKLIGVNPREYYPAMVERIHTQQELLTPSEFAAQRAANTG